MRTDKNLMLTILFSSNLGIAGVIVHNDTADPVQLENKEAHSVHFLQPEQRMTLPETSLSTGLILTHICNGIHKETLLLKYRPQHAIPNEVILDVSDILLRELEGDLATQFSIETIKSAP